MPVIHRIYRVFPEWKVHSAFISKALAAAFTLDAKLSSHPIEVPCPNERMIGQVLPHLLFRIRMALTRWPA